MSDYISREAFLEKERRLYCQDCSRRKNSNGKLVYEIGDAPCRACGIGDVLDDFEDFPTAIPPHGRLIDADALIRELEITEEDDHNGATLLMAVFLEVLKAAPTIIPAEEGET